jgi:hypothetical protein
MDSVRLLHRIVQSLAALGLRVSRPQLTNLALLCQALAFSSSCHLATLALAVPLARACYALLALSMVRSGYDTKSLPE